MLNRRVKLAVRGAGVPLWRLAQELELSESTLFRRLRKPLTREEEEQYLSAIEKAAGGGTEHDER